MIDPELGADIVELGMVTAVRIAEGGDVGVEVALTVAGCPLRTQIESDVETRVAAVPGVRTVTVGTGVMDAEQRKAVMARARLSARDPAPDTDIPDSARVIAVASGKGGVGKSSITVNLAVAMARRGFDVGILDADVYGFSVPKMLGITADPLIIGDLVVPPTANAVRCLSMGYFVPDDTPVIWRGPMLHKALEQFLVDAYWGEPDYLLIDMPPGTGDVTLSLGQYLTKTEVYVVTTPQPAAERVAQRSAYAARKLKLAVRGVIENMSWFTGDDGTRYELFGSGGGRQLADELGVPLLAQVPLVPALRQGGDDGIPVMVADPEGEAAAIFDQLATSIIDLGPARVYRKELSVR